MLFQVIHRTCGEQSRNHKHKHGVSKGLRLNHDSTNIIGINPNPSWVLAMNHTKAITSIPGIANMIHAKTLENNGKRKKESRSKLELIIAEAVKQSS